MPTPVSPTKSYVGFGREATAGTAVAPTFFLPVRDLKPEDLKHYLPDKNLRGSFVSEYAMIPTQGWSTYELGGEIFVDGAGWQLKGLLGDESATLTGGSSTTLNSSAAAGATSISTVADPGNSGVIQIDTGTVAELRTITSRIGAGPYTVNFATALAYAHNSGATVKYNGTGPYTHQFSLYNGGQPPSTTITDYNGFNARAWAYSMFEEFSFKGGAQTLLEHTTKGIGFLSATASTPTQSFSTVSAKAAYNATVTLAGSTTGLVENIEGSIKRKVEPIITINGSTSPQNIWDNELEVTLKGTMVYQDDTFLSNYLAGTQTSFDFVWTSGSGVTTQTFLFHSSQAFFTKFHVPRSATGKAWVSADFEVHCVGNTSDVGGSGGYSPCYVQLVNATSTTY